MFLLIHKLCSLKLHAIDKLQTNIGLVISSLDHVFVCSAKEMNVP